MEAMQPQTALTSFSIALQANLHHYTKFIDKEIFDESLQKVENVIEEYEFHRT